VHRVRHSRERLTVDRLQKRLISGQIVDVINESEFLQDF
jgi:hypothetical protein